jgi:hypothetical protein
MWRNTVLCPAFVLWFALAFFLGVAPNESSEHLDAYYDREAYEVFAAMLASSGSFAATRGKSLVIQKETIVDTNPCVEPGKASAPIIGPVIADYIMKNAKRRELQQKFDIDKSYVFVGREEFEAFFKGKGATGWKAFYDAYPESGGIVEFSAVGFNHSKTIAMVRMSTLCGSLCGGGTYHLLQKKNGKWQPLKSKSDGGRSCAWAS